MPSTKKPTCHLCHARQSSVFCLIHKTYCCEVCVHYHDQPGVCQWEAAAPLAILRQKDQLSLFEEETADGQVGSGQIGS